MKRKGVWHSTASRDHPSANQRENIVDRDMWEVTWQPSCHHRTPPTTGPTTESNNQPTEPAEPTQPNTNEPTDGADPKSRGAAGATAQRPPGPARPKILLSKMNIGRICSLVGPFSITGQIVSKFSASAYRTYEY